MQLLTEEIKKLFTKYGPRSQDGKGGDALVIVKYFNPVGAGTWLIIEGEKLPNGDYMLFGLCNLFEWEWGYVSLSELQNLRLPFNMSIEREITIGAGKKTVSEVLKGMGIEYPFSSPKKKVATNKNVKKKTAKTTTKRNNPPKKKAPASSKKKVK